MDPIFQKTFNEQERQDRISNSKLASFLAIILMPAGMSLDYFVYPQHLWIFLAVRILASCLIGLVWCWFLLGQEKHDRVFGVMWYMIPAAAIVWMIYYTKDPLSPYY